MLSTQKSIAVTALAALSFLAPRELDANPSVELSTAQDTRYDRLLRLQNTLKKLGIFNELQKVYKEAFEATAEKETLENLKTGLKDLTAFSTNAGSEDFIRGLARHKDIEVFYENVKAFKLIGSLATKLHFHGAIADPKRLSPEDLILLDQQHSFERLSSILMTLPELTNRAKVFGGSVQDWVKSIGELPELCFTLKDRGKSSLIAPHELNPFVRTVQEWLKKHRASDLNLSKDSDELKLVNQFEGNLKALVILAARNQLLQKLQPLWRDVNKEVVSFMEKAITEYSFIPHHRDFTKILEQSVSTVNPATGLKVLLGALSFVDKNGSFRSNSYGEKFVNYFGIKNGLKFGGEIEGLKELRKLSAILIRDGSKLDQLEKQWNIKYKLDPDSYSENNYQGLRGRYYKNYRDSKPVNSVQLRRALIAGLWHRDADTLIFAPEIKFADRESVIAKLYKCDSPEFNQSSHRTTVYGSRLVSSIQMLRAASLIDASLSEYVKTDDQKNNSFWAVDPQRSSIETLAQVEEWPYRGSKAQPGDVLNAFGIESAEALHVKYYGTFGFLTGELREKVAPISTVKKLAYKLMRENLGQNPFEREIEILSTQIDTVSNQLEQADDKANITELKAENEKLEGELTRIYSKQDSYYIESGLFNPEHLNSEMLHLALMSDLNTPLGRQLSAAESEHLLRLRDISGYGPAATLFNAFMFRPADLLSVFDLDGDGKVTHEDLIKLQQVSALIKEVR